MRPAPLHHMSRVLNALRMPFIRTPAKEERTSRNLRAANDTKPYTQFTSEIGHDAQRTNLPCHNLIILSRVAQADSLMRGTTKSLNPRIARSLEEVSAHFDAERFKLVVVECNPEHCDLVQSAIEIQRLIPQGDATALIIFKRATQECLDMLRYTPSAAAFSFLSVRPDEIRTHIQDLLAL
ncbi:hypothetical protein [Celeribacter halophilus]|uniref:Uncharacterized protein n=1 Tax=Celeribacter halophilus TaxID=576117 RepID=A0A1I3MMP3_9RHOB|nr:hypothetical protein [Celeribacter halophilus]PZX15433.1 hypothetical protein LX82_00062 [Celeribacter halophilus]SFI97946.1 hypothetical protein SAMN04488138_10162 [Celeribacter halophilus]